ncbi:zf-HC2 domain-containing protein [Actinopolymorpha alba]|uniref:zf-HC2 domain-containing protein n=1 Tax=Actinopolymorpha alba TaxID=533267 RepID=UPI0003659F6C|nr:zf-HC2 domain-containing protein [Actinopolymorpha alba]
MTCAEVRAALGAYVLRALEESEAADVRDHLAGCAGCRAAYDDIAGVPALLSALNPDEVSHGLPSPSETGLHHLLARVRQERARERRRHWRNALVAAALVAVAVGGTGWAAGRWLPPREPVVQATPAPTPRLTGVPVQWSVVDPATKVNATVIMSPLAWGTKVDIVVRGVKQGDVCSLVVYDRSGRRWDGGSWRVAYARGVRWSGGVAVATDQVARVEIFAPGEKPLVRLEGS